MGFGLGIASRLVGEDASARFNNISITIADFSKPIAASSDAISVVHSGGRRQRLQYLILRIGIDTELP